MHCIPKDIFEPQEFLDSLTCTIGMGIFNDPVTLPCQHVFCRKCIEKSLEANGVCPTCKAKTTLQSLTPQPYFNELIYISLVKCPRCTWSGDYQSFCLHEKKCVPPRDECPLRCGTKLSKKELSDHLLNCKFRRIVCKDCKKEIYYAELLFHDDDCPMKKVLCKGCGLSTTFNDRSDHIKNCQELNSLCNFAFCGCDSIDDKIHHQTDLATHISMLGLTMAKLMYKVDIIENAPISSEPSSEESYDTAKSNILVKNDLIKKNNEPPIKESLGVKIIINWSNNKPIIRGTRNDWSFFLSNEMIYYDFLAKIRINHLGNDSNSWKICLGLFTSNQSLVGSWGTYRNGYGYILMNGNKVHVSGPERYGEPYNEGDIISILYKSGNITFLRNDKSQGIAFYNVEGPFYLAASISHTKHEIQILEVTLLGQQ